MGGPGDVRVSNPDSTSLYESLSFKSKKPDLPPQPQEEKVIATQDKNNVTSAEESKSVKNVDFVEGDKNLPPNFAPLINQETQEELKFKVNEKGLPILGKEGELQPDDKGKTVYVAVNENSEPILDKNESLIFLDTDTIGKIKANAEAQAKKAAESTGKAAPDNQNEVAALAPLINNETKEKIKVKVDDNGLPIVDKDGNVQPDENGKFAYVKLDAQSQPLTKDGKIQFASEADAEKFKQEVAKPSAADPTQAAQPPQQQQVAGMSPLVNSETQEPIKIKVDDKGLPILDKDGAPQPDENGKMVFVKIDAEGNPVPGKDGKPQFVAEADVEKTKQEIIKQQQEQALKEFPEPVQKALKAIGGHGGQRMVAIGQKAFGEAAIKKVSTGVVTYTVKKAVTKAVSNELKALQAVKSGTTTVVAASKTAATKGAENAIKVLEKSGKLGQGVVTNTMKEATGVAGNLLNPKNAAQFVKKAPGAVAKSATETAAHVAAQVGEKGVVKGTGAVVGKTIVGAGEKVIQTGVEKGVEKGVQAAIKKGGAEIVEKVATKTTEKALIKAAEKGAVKATETVAVKGAAKLASFVPVAGAVAGAAITAWDTKDAIEKSKSGAGTASVALAWTTVGLDAVSTAATATGIGAPIGWIATGLSIGTGFLSDLVRKD